VRRKSPWVRIPPPPQMQSEYEELMKLALLEGELAMKHGDVPVGALVVFEGRIIASRHNEREKSGDPTAHAEILALRDASQLLDSWRLIDCSLVVTLEPCLMCAGATLNSRVRKVIFGAFDPNGGAMSSLYGVHCDPRLNHNCEIVSGVLKHDSELLIRRFFQSNRKAKNME
jgi:tRNA(adenine34) deaminase